MTKSQTGAGLVAGAIAFLLLAAMAIWAPGASDKESGSTRPLVQLPPLTTTAPAVPPARPQPGSFANDSQALPDPRIASTLEDSGATFRSVRAADGANKIVCGEVRGSGRSYFRRFVWISEAQLLATDDGGPQFESVARLCDGRVALGPA
jgi:hypothetical protein